RPPSVPPDLEPAPLFSPRLDSTDTQQLSLAGGVPHSQGLSYLQVPPPNNSLGLQHIDPSGPPLPGLQHQHRHQQQQLQSHNNTSNSAHALRPPETLGFAQQIGPPDIDQLSAPRPAINTLFDSNEESYLNSFLSSFDVEGFDLGPYLASPAPMASFSSRTDFGTMGMGMGIGAGMMGAMDDSIPHLSLVENSQDMTAASAAARRLTHMSQTPITAGVPGQMHSAGIGGMMPMRRASFFDYGLGGSSHLSLGNVMSEEMHKVSSWLIQNQGHQSDLSANMAGSAFAAATNGASSNAPYANGADQQQHQHQHQHQALSQPQVSPINNINIPGQQHQSGPGASGFAGPPSESDYSIKRKASQEQLGQPRKSRGSVWSPMREMPPALAGPGVSGDGLAAMQHASSANSNMLLSAVSAFAEPIQRDPESANSKTKASSAGEAGS
ncbi:hypothetical protein LPJ56_003344, partial [Coemansia sp. RSA 2599]